MPVHNMTMRICDIINGIKNIQILILAHTCLFKYKLSSQALLHKALSADSFYFSYTYDLSHTLQRLNNVDERFRSLTFIERADERFVWNRYLLSEVRVHEKKKRSLDLEIRISFSFETALVATSHRLCNYDAI